MSDRIAARWRALQSDRRVALIPYLTAGYPSRSESLAAVRAVADAGADFVEVGIPFTDPLADGPVIQRASQVALQGGMTTAGVLAMVREADLGIPVIAFSYLNPLLAFGLERFAEEAAAAGVDGVLVTDLPAAEDPGAEAALRRAGLDLVRLVAPTTAAERLALVTRGATGFIYVIARLGVTGPRTVLGPEVERVVQRVRSATPLPIALGFGIGSAQQAQEAGRLADGVVVGSALVERLSRGTGPAAEFITELRAALDAVPALR